MWGVLELRRGINHLLLGTWIHHSAVEVPAVSDDKGAKFQILDVSLDHGLKDVDELLEAWTPVGILGPALEHHLVAVDSKEVKVKTGWTERGKSNETESSCEET